MLLTRFGASSRYRVWLGVAVLVFLLAIGYRYGVYYFSKQDMAQCLHWISQLPGLCEGFFLGVLVAKYAQYRNETNFIATAADRRRTAVIFASGLLSSIVLVILLEDVNKQYWDSWQFPTLFRSGVAIAFALIVWAAVRFDTETDTARSKQGNALRTLAGHLGAWSYGIYLWHLPVLLMLKKSNFSGALLFILTLSITVAVAAASYRWFEQPCMQWARRRAQ
jgi:peptidoglycan/LPS O-acetylase OafA/YrhL